MAVTSAVGRVFGNVTYTDGSVGTFGASLDVNGIVSTTVGNVPEFEQLYLDNQAGVDATINLLDSGISLSVGTAGNGKVVSDYVFEVSGSIAEDDGTSGSFSVQWDAKNGARAVDDASGANWVKATNVAAFNAFMVTWLEAVIGAGTTTL